MSAVPTPKRPAAVLRGLLLAFMLSAVALPATGRASAWDIRAPSAVPERGPILAADSYALSGDARLSFGCTANGVLFAGLHYVGYETVASALRVAYRVDGRNEIAVRWLVEPRDTELLLYSSNPVYVHELARRVMRGNWLNLSVELLPRLRFSLAGSSRTVSQVLDLCGNSAGDPGDPFAPDDQTAEAEAGTPGAGPHRQPGDPTPLIPDP